MIVYILCVCAYVGYFVPIVFVEQRTQSSTLVVCVRACVWQLATLRQARQFY